VGVECIRPDVDGGRFPIKRTPGEPVEVSATIFADGHDVIAAVVRDRSRSTAEHAETAEQNTVSAISANSALRASGHPEPVEGCG
jgi:starch synthase (maltosyl-transferring)